MRISQGQPHYLNMPHSRRRLPHQYTEGKWLFLTWHTHGSLPHGRYPPPAKAAAGEAFVWVDRYLDRAGNGPLYLRQPAIARIVVDSLHRGTHLGHYDLGAFVVMANHVHALLLPKVDPSRLLQSMKGFTAREANRIWVAPENTSGRPNPTTIGCATNESTSASSPTSRRTR